MLQQTLRWVTLGALFAIPVVIPFIVSASMFFPYITGKNFTFRILVEVALVGWMLLALFDARYRPRFSWVLAAMTLFVLTVGMATIFSSNPFKSFWSNFERMEGYIGILHVFVYFVVASIMLNSERLWTAFWYSSLGTSVVIAFIGFSPILRALPELTYPRIDATFGNPIYLAIYSLFHIFIALVLITRWRGTYWHQVVLGTVAVLHFITMVFTMTRGTVLGFLGGALVTTILVAVLERERKVLRFAAIASLLVVVAIVGGAYAIKDTEWAKTIPLVSRFTQIELTSGTVKARFMNWGMAWEGVKERPLLGYGQDNYEYVFSKHYDPNMFGEEPWFDRTHNVMFDWLIAAGFLGLIAYFLVPTALLMHLWVLDPHERKWSWRSLTSFSAIRTLIAKRDDVFPATERALWTGLLVAYMFHNLFVFDNLVSYFLYASVLAYLHWRVTQGHTPLCAKREVEEQTVTSVALPVLLVLGGLMIWYVNVPGITTSRLLIDALTPQRVRADGTAVQQSPEEMLEVYKRALAIDALGRQEVREQVVQRAADMLRTQGVKQETKDAFRDLAIAEMERELARNDESARLWLFHASLLANAGRLEEAEKAFEKALERTPTKQHALMQLGEVRIVRGKTEEGLALFKQAYESAPQFDELAKMYATALVRVGRDKEAVDLLTERFGTPAVDDSRLFMAWVQAKRYDIASKILEQRVEQNPDDVEVVVSLAAAYRELGRKEEALGLLRGVAERKPEYKEQMDAFILEVQKTVPVAK
ncbi:MAG: tetratricopeptide repeat protein [Candidatus Pacebacteria bacterium]|nr:tetratricopeptide repeat protein [Candidatus Paceibacterota bacterium]